jgi:hypothetical protein
MQGVQTLFKMKDEVFVHLHFLRAVFQVAPETQLQPLVMLL